MTALQKMFVVVTLVAVGAEIYEVHQAAMLRHQVATFQRQQIFLYQKIQQRRCEANAATNLSFTNAGNGYVRGNVAGINIAGILTDPNFRMVLHALQQRSGFETLAEPEVVTTSGRGQNSIRMENVVWNIDFSTTNQLPTFCQ